MPPGCEPDGDAALVPVFGKHYYERIRYPLGDAPPLVFLLIPPGKGNPGPFYIMRDKVSRQQFRTVMAGRRARELLEPSRKKLAASAAVGVGAGGLYEVFAGKYPWAVSREWEEEAADPATDPLPAVNVTVLEAHYFALCVGGKLPSDAQWRKAAGEFDGQEGPFKQGWKPGGIALGRDDPAPVGTSPDDESGFHCRDMAGNGRELTRDLTDPRRDGTDPFTEPREQDFFRFRGHSFRRDRPYVFKNDEAGAAGFHGRSEDGGFHGRPEDDVSFRVVIEPSPGS
jgi:hypothetical protein